MKNLFYKLQLYISLIRHKGLKKNYYSRWAEDLFLVNYFKKINKGSYIDLGAFHPYRSSNTYLLHKKGWSGINIDLNKKSIDLFKIARPKDINLNLAILDRKKKIRVYKRKDLGIMNTTNLNFASLFLKDFYTENTRAYNLNYILKKFKPKKTKFELIDIDAEGSEYLILKKLNFKKYSFKLILVETHKIDLHTKKYSKKIHQLLKSKNYKYIKNLGETAIFENKKWKI